MKIFIAQKISIIGGAERYLLSLLPELQKSRVDVVFGMFYEGHINGEMHLFIDEMKASGVRLEMFYISKIPQYRQLSCIAVHIKKEQYDLIHTHLFVTDCILFLIKAIFLKGIILVSTKHGYNEVYLSKNGFGINKMEKWYYRILAKIVEKKINRSFAVSRAIGNLYIGLGICEISKLDTIYHGFDYPVFSPNPALRKSNHQIILVGRLTAYKGHRFLIEAMKYIAEVLPDCHLLILGDGLERANLENLVKELGLEARISFVGFVTNALEYMTSSDVVVIPSIAEPFGLVFLEAMSCKKAVVCFNVAAGNEILENNVTGLLVDPFNVKSLSDSILSLLVQSEWCNEIGMNAYYEQQRNFTLKRMTDNTITFYRKVLYRNI